MHGPGFVFRSHNKPIELKGLEDLKELEIAGVILFRTHQ